NYNGDNRNQGCGLHGNEFVHDSHGGGHDEQSANQRHNCQCASHFVYLHPPFIEFAVESAPEYPWARFGGLPVAPALNPDTKIPSHRAAWDAASTFPLAASVLRPEILVALAATCAP